jgi:5-(carboxyamino)imidazole ribonucleotide synthase
VILPGATLGILGGGQLGRMFTVAARTMGYHVVVLDPGQDSPAGRMADEHLRAAYTDDWALDLLARECDVITTEFENVPAQALRRLEVDLPVRPSSKALAATQDRSREKEFIRGTDLPTADFEAIESPSGLRPAYDKLSPPLMLKRAAFGYDGKGQARIDDFDALQTMFASLGNVPCVLERRVDLKQEFSVVLARSSHGETACFPPAENIHRRGILNMSIVPARLKVELAGQARDMATRLAEALDYCGVMAVEFFVTGDDRLLVNEIAPRPHNSGHYTIDACVSSQFEQQVRMVCGLPPADTRLLSPVVMINLLGDLWSNRPPDWSRALRCSRVKLHLYGKREARAGRKMGHFCYLHQDLDAAIQGGQDVLKQLALPRRD